MRGHIANLAARLMAVDGIDEFALAKRKAARQAGAPDTRSLPTNEEVEQALRAYQQLYMPDEQAARLRHLREKALEMMKILQPFNPFLSGAVLRGSASKYTEIELHLFTDAAKEVELFLLNRQIGYRSRDRRVWVGDDLRSVSSYLISTAEADFEITVFSRTDMRTNLRNTADGRPFDRGSQAEVETLLLRGDS